MTTGRLTLFWRLVLSMSVVASLAVVTSVAFLYLSFAAANNRFREDTLFTFAKGIAKGYPNQQGGYRFVVNRLAELHGQFAVVTAPDDTVIAASPGISAPLAPPDEAEKSYFVLPTHDGIPSLYGLTLRLEGSAPPTFVQVAFPRSHLIFDSLLEEFVGEIAWIWIPFVLVILATNLVIVKLALQPLNRAAREAEQIGPASITTRLSEGEMPSDVLAIVQAVNNALGRLQEGYLALERFSGNLVHELRTPMAVIKARLSSSQVPVARELEQDFHDMERLVSQLVDRIRLGGLHFEHGDRVDLGELARRVASFLAPIIVSRGRLIEVSCPDAPVMVSGAADFIFRALRNLIENATEYSPLNGTISVVVNAQGTITVIDGGCGFPASRLDPETRRNSRSRSDRADGLGLGLSIVDETMVAHGGHLILRNPAGGGASATMTFPSMDSHK